MATAHVWPFDTVKADPRYDSSPVTAPGAVTTDTMRRALKATQPILDKIVEEAKEQGRELARRIPPCVGHAAQDPDERPGDYLEERYASGGLVGGPERFVFGEKPSPMDHPAIVKRFAELSASARYPAPLRADLVTLWKRNGTTVLSITADGKVHDFHLPPARLVVLLREIAEQLAENTVLQ